MKSAPRMKTLIIKMGALGDMVLASPFIHAVVHYHAGQPVQLLTSTSFANLYHGLLPVHAVPRRGVLAFWQTLRWVRAQRFDRVYDLQGSDSSAILVALSGIAQRVCSRTHFPYNYHPPMRYRYGEVHITERLTEVLDCIGVPVTDMQPRLPISQDEYARVQQWLLSHRLVNQPLVLIHAGASPAWPTKCWPYFIQLARLLTAQGFMVVWLGAGHDAPANARYATEVGVDASNQFSVRELAALGQVARFAVTSDSGVMHVISCAGLPIYSFFGPSNPVQSHALGQAERVLTHKVPCHPCFLRRCPDERAHQCLAGMSAEDVMRRLERDGMLVH